jgi:signal transduction histidine kinase
MQPRPDTATHRLLAGAELWMRDHASGPDRALTVGTTEPGAATDGTLVMVAGWEDGHPACAPFAAADGGSTCRGCPVGLVEEVLRSRHAVAERCPFGIRILAFPAPAGSRDSAVILRMGGPETTAADLPSGIAVLRAARRLRRPGGLVGWQAEQRTRGAERRRTAAAALAQMIATTEEFHRLWTTADRDRASADQTVSRLDTLARETLRESEESQTRIAHTLHDTAAQSMVSAHRFLEASRASLGGPRPESASGHLDAAQERLLTAIREVRQVLNTLVPPGLEELGLANALTIHVRDNVGGTITANVTGDLPRAEHYLEAGLFAMTAEAISNAVEHAGPTRIRIDLRASRGRGIITVTDDGVGFDPSSAHRQTLVGMGLIGMARRAGWLGGRVDVTSRPGAGTTIRISVPLSEPEAPAEAGDTPSGGRDRP